MNEKGLLLMYLIPYDSFPFDDFAKGKKFEVTEMKPWIDYDTGRRLGTTVTVSIAEDHSEYPPSANGEVRDNYRQVFSVKVGKETVAVNRFDLVRFVGVRAKIYGEFRNQLSVEADDVVLDTAPARGEKAEAKK